MWSCLSEKPLPYNIRNGNSLQLRHVESYRFGINSLRFRGSRLWNNLPFSVIIKNKNLKINLGLWEIFTVLAQCVERNVLSY